MDVRVLGLGNVLMGDDGFGPHVVESFAAAYDLPDGMTAVDLGTPGLDLAPFLIGADAVIVVDSIRADAAAGTVKVYPRERLLTRAPAARLGPHDPGFAQTLLALEFADLAPRQVYVVGAVPETTAPCARLSPTLRAAVPQAITAIVAILEQLGVPPAPRADAGMAAMWWERTT